MLTISDRTIIRLHPLERQVLEKLLTLTDRELSAEDLDLLKRQINSAIILSRKMTGVGFYTEFLVGEDARRLPKRNSFWFGGVVVGVPGLRDGAGFQFYIKKGVIDQLEGFCFDEHWPDPWPGQYDESERYQIFELPRSKNRESR